MVRDPERLATLRRMYLQWPFFTALIDNTELALAKSDSEIAAEYASLANQSEAMQAIAERIRTEFDSSCQTVLAIIEAGVTAVGDPLAARLHSQKESIRGPAESDPGGIVSPETQRLQRFG